MNTLVLAFDIERSGSRFEHDTLAIGCSILDNNLNELDSLFLPCYFPNETTFEKRCWNEFWSKHIDKLNEFKYTGTKTKNDREKECIEMFQNFRIKWENYALKNDMILELVTDNPIFDGGFINEWINTKTDALPMPYIASTPQTYNTIWDTYSIQRGIMAVVDPSYNMSYGFFNRLKELFNLPDKGLRQHDHHPVNDAYCIAFEHQIFLSIKHGKYSVRDNNSSPKTCSDEQ